MLSGSITFAGELASDEWWARQGSTFPSVPPEATLRDVLRDVFDAMSLPQGFAGRASSHNPSSAPDVGSFRDEWGFSAGLPKSAPASSLASRYCLSYILLPRAWSLLRCRLTSCKGNELSQKPRTRALRLVMAMSLNMFSSEDQC